jgi:hypothetical protein
MWIDYGKDRCCGFSKVGIVETAGFHQVMWFVMLESAKDWILGVDTPGQYVSPHVQYGTTWLLIRNTIGCVSCSVEWGWHHTLWSVFVTYFVNHLNHMVKEGTFVQETLALEAGTICSGNRSKAWHTPVVDFVIACSDLWAIHQRKRKEWQKGGSLVTDRWWNHYVWVQGTNICRVYNCHDSRACGYKRSGILPRIEGMVWEWDGWIWFGIALRHYVIICALCDSLWTFVDQTLWLFCSPLCLCDHTLWYT